MKTAFLAILLFGIMIFPHELGHFIAAKRMGIQVNEFAFGMGPIIWKKQRGETLHTIRLFPLGGFCAMQGENGEEGEASKEYNPRAFNSKSPQSRIIVLTAGALMNIFCAFLIMTLIIGIAGFQTTSIGEIMDNSPAAISGLKVGDRITAIDGRDIESWQQVGEIVSAGNGEQLGFSVLRKGEDVSLNIIPVFNAETDRYAVGILPKISHNPIKAAVYGAKSTVNLFGVMAKSLGMLFSGQAGMDDISGPVGIVKIVSDTQSYGYMYFGFIAALISVNVACINLLPLPALDGGRILIILFSWITGKKVSQRVEGFIHFAGMLLLLGLMVYVTFNDVGRLFGG